MSNTTVIVTYSNGSTREFIASDELEKLIDEGEMFSITTMHSDMGEMLEMQVSKMHVGNPIAALGDMIIMRSNAESILKEDSSATDMKIVIDTLTACIKLLSDEITSHQSNMSPVNSKWCDGCNPDNCTCYNKDDIGSFGDKKCDEECPVINDICVHYRVLNKQYEKPVYYCGHSENKGVKGENDCTGLHCPLCTEGGGS